MNFGKSIFFVFLSPQLDYPPTRFFTSGAETWGKQMVKPEEQFAEVSAPETHFAPTEINFCSA